MRFGSVCSGIEAASIAWQPLGWEPAFYSEIDAFPRAVLKHHHPDVPLHGDFTTIEKNQYGTIRLLVGGTPCQSFSVAGLRGGMDDQRGNLALEYIRLAERERPDWLVWENVPGVFSSNGGEDFRCFLSGLVRWSVPMPAGGWQNSGIIASGPVDGAYGVAWRVFDAQHFGLAQRRQRVFVVGYSGDWRAAAAILFEQESLRGDPPPSRRPQQGAAPDVAKSFRGNSGGIEREDMHTLIHCPPVANTLTARMHKGINTTLDEGQTPIAVHGTQDPDILENTAHTLGRNSGQGNAVAIMENQRGEVRIDEIAGSVSSGGGKPGQGYQAVAFQPRYARNGRGAPDEIAAALTGEAGRTGKGDSAQCVNDRMRVRRLTPRECERLQGFPDDYTAIPWRGKPAEQCPDGPRYRALGNSMAVPVMAWIGRRIDMFEKLVDDAIEVIRDMHVGDDA